MMTRRLLLLLICEMIAAVGVSTAVRARTGPWDAGMGGKLTAVAAAHNDGSARSAKTDELAIGDWPNVVQGTNVSSVAAQVSALGRSIVYVVRPGDTLWGIASRHGTTVQSLMRENGLWSHVIHPGQRLRIPSQGPPPTGRRGTYVVRSGDTLWAISRRYGTTPWTLMRLNGLSSTLIYVGQRLRVPGWTPAPIPTPVPLPWPTPKPRPLPTPVPVGGRPEVFLAPWTGSHGTRIAVTAVDFPPLRTVSIGVGPYGSEFRAVGQGVTDASGRMVTTVEAQGEPGMNLVIAVRTTPIWGSAPFYASALFRITR